MKKLSPVVLCLLMGSTGLAHGQTLDEALAAAYRNNPTLMSGRAKLRAVDEQVPQALADWRPTVDVVGDVGTSANMSNGSTGVDRNQHRDPRSLGLNLSQSIYKGGQTQAAISGAENTVSAERHHLDVVEQTVLLNAVKAYMDVFRDQAVLELNINNEQVLRRQLEATEDRFQVGEITRTDVSQAQSRLARATADRIDTEGLLEITRATYLNVVGESPGKLVRPPAPEDIVAGKDDAIKAAAVSNPNVIEAEYLEKAQSDNVKKTQGELLPSLDLSSSAKRSFDSSGEHSRVDAYEAKLTLTMPIYQKGAVYSRLREAKQLVGEQRRKTDQARRNAIETATQAWEALQTARARIDSFKTQINASEIALEGVEREAAVGSRTVLDILDAEQELLNAKVSMVRSQRDETVAIFQLKEAMGKLTARQMNLPVDLYDPAGHYLEVRDKWFGGSSTGGAEDFDGGESKAGE
ncbi:MAG: hypothetical protein A3G18_10915 [Rhodospirillales bacterium RIFCSPLOWO2_12_FULL_58_28]|nr:MAG: hypothetical protein A3G18_10915 [Rhodospirillales bacterium RIFCSPLOWO2_12_FULL_58_28]